MSAEAVVWSLAAASVATLLVAGVFLAFSDFTVRSLRLAAPAAGSQAMQILNREVFRSIFIVLLIGMSGVSALIGVLALIRPPAVGGGAVLAGSACYVVGVFGVTMLGNVPMNQKLAALPDGGPEAQAYWPDYVTGWVFWNHVRTLFSFLAGALYLAAAMLMALAT